MRHRLTAVALLLAGTLAVSPAQEGDESPAATGPLEDAARLLSPILFPKILADISALRSYIVSEEFARLRETSTDPAAVDAIFLRAVETSWKNVGEALFVATVATMDHRRVGFDLPLVGPLLWFPLTEEEPDEFQLRLGALPSRLYPDTPDGAGGDRDKLQHFFGSAFLAFVTENQAVPEEVGEAIERGEASFVVDGRSDSRDRRANRQGQEFGLSLLRDPGALPSSFLTYWLAATEAPAGAASPPHPPAANGLKISEHP